MSIKQIGRIDGPDGPVHYTLTACTDEYGIKPSNCAASYPGNGRNPASQDQGGGDG